MITTQQAEYAVHSVISNDGAFGILYKAHRHDLNSDQGLSSDLDTNSEVALKVKKGSHVSFKNEIKILQILPQHKNILQLIDWNESLIVTNYARYQMFFLE